MGSEFEKVKAGDEIEIKASLWNEFIGAAEYTRQQKNQPKTTNPVLPRNTAVIKVQNDSGVVIDRYRAVGVTDVLCTPTTTVTDDVTGEFLNRVAVKVGTPAAGGLWLVTLETLGVGDVGLAAVAGIVQVWANVVNTADTKVDANGTNNTPDTNDSKGYDLIWVKGGVGTAEATGEQWVLVRLIPKLPKLIAGGWYCNEDDAPVWTYEYTGGLDDEHKQYVDTIKFGEWFTTDFDSDSRGGRLTADWRGFGMSWQTREPPSLGEGEGADCHLIEHPAEIDGGDCGDAWYYGKQLYFSSDKTLATVGWTITPDGSSDDYSITGNVWTLMVNGTQYVTSLDINGHTASEGEGYDKASIDWTKVVAAGGNDCEGYSVSLTPSITLPENVRDVRLVVTNSIASCVGTITVRLQKKTNQDDIWHDCDDLLTLNVQSLAIPTAWDCNADTGAIEATAFNNVCVLVP